MRGRYSILEKSLWLVLWASLIFFGRYRTQGLQPDAALYAGLSYKVLHSGEYWALKGSDNKFTQFFEHPPFFYQWGSVVLKFLGESDGAARAIGGIPGCLGMLSLLFWAWWRFGWLHAMVSALIFATFTHYTKYAATAMLEGPLSWGVIWVAIAAFECHWQKHSTWRRPFFLALLALGLMLATASKGVMGLGAWGGLCLSLGLGFFFSPRSVLKLFLSSFTLLPWLLISLVPFGIWIYMMFRQGVFAWIEGYFINQVFRSATTNRGEFTHLVAGDPGYYVKQMFWAAAPWMPIALLASLMIWLAPLLARHSFFAAFGMKRRGPGRGMLLHLDSLFCCH